MYTDDYEESYQTVTAEFRLDQYDSVYDADGVFYCKWIALSDSEKEIVKQNPVSFY